MKQLFGAGLIALLLISIFPAVVAVTGTEDSQTLSLVSSMEDKTGKEIRLMQLEKAITRNIVAGKVAIEKVKANDIDASELEVILTELEALRLEVKSINPEEEGAVETFVNIKNEAMELSKEFKEIAADLLAQDDITAIENEVNDNPELQEYKLRIKEKIQLKNKESVQKTFDSIGIKNEVLLAKIKNGGVTLAEVKNQIEEKTKGMTPKEKQAALVALKESGVKKDIAARAKMENAKLKVDERTAEKSAWLTKAAAKISDPSKKAKIQNLLDKKVKDKKELVEKEKKTKEKLDLKAKPKNKTGSTK